MSHPGPRTPAAHWSRRSLLVICLALSGCVSGRCPGGFDSAPAVCESGSEKITNTMQSTTPAPVVRYRGCPHCRVDLRPVSGRVHYSPAVRLSPAPMETHHPLTKRVEPEGLRPVGPAALSKVPALSPPESVLSRTPQNVDAATK